MRTLLWPSSVCRMKDDPVSLICDYQLPVANDGKESAWACSLAWLPSSSVTQTMPTFYMSPGAEGCVHAQLAVGCTNGQVFSVRWELSGVNGVYGPVSSNVSSLNGVTGVCSITGVTGVIGRVDETLCLWEESDGVPVCCIASQPKVSSQNPRSSLLWGEGRGRIGRGGGGMEGRMEGRRGNQRRYDMRHEMLTQRALFCHRANTITGTLSQHFVTHVVPPPRGNGGEEGRRGLGGGGNGGEGRIGRRGNGGEGRIERRGKRIGRRGNGGEGEEDWEEGEWRGGED